MVAIEGAAVPELVKLKQERDVKLAEDPPGGGRILFDLYLDVIQKCDRNRRWGDF